MKIVYITGCLGFIGSYVTRKCLERGWHVRGIDKCTYASDVSLLKEFNNYNSFIFERKDINDIKFLYDCDYFINIGAETHVGNSITDSDDFINSNINGVHNILNLLKNYRQENYHKPRLIHFSTDEVYGDITDGEHTESDLLKPSNPYSATKAAADMLILAWARTYNIKYNILRLTNNYGIGQYVEKLIPKSIKFLSLNRKIPLHNNGSPIRNWLHAEDSAEATLKIIEKGKENEIYNICGGFELSNLEVIQSIINLYFNKEVNFEDYLDLSYSRPGQDVRYALNDKKTQKLGWATSKDFSKELPEIVEFYKNRFIW